MVVGQSSETRVDVREAGGGDDDNSWCARIRDGARGAKYPVALKIPRGARAPRQLDLLRGGRGKERIGQVRWRHVLRPHQDHVGGKPVIPDGVHGFDPVVVISAVLYGEVRHPHGSEETSALDPTCGWRAVPPV